MKLKNTIRLIFVMLLFYFAAVQLNDPDPFHWVVVYLFTAALIAIKSVQNNKPMYWAVAMVLMLWAIDVFPPEWEGVMLNEMGMKTLNIELGRESLGLAICSILLFIVSFF